MNLKSGTSSFWLRSVFFTLLQRFSIIAFGVIGYILLAKKVFPGAHEMGIWSLFLGIIALIESIKQGLLRNPMIKFLSEPEYVNNRNKIQSASLITNILFSVLSIVIIAFAGHLLVKWLNSPELYPLIIWGILIILLLIPFNHCEVLLQANYKFHHIFYGYFLRQGIFLIALVAVLLYDKSMLTLLNLVKLQIVSIFFGALMLIWFARPFFYRHFDTEKKTMLKMFHFGKYIFGTNVFSAFGRSADQFITAGQISAEVVAYYNVVARINNMMDVPSLAVADVLFPKNVEAMASSGEEKVRYYFERMVGTIIAILAPVSVLIFLMPKLFIMLLAGSKYYDAVPILEIVILFSFLRPFSYQFGATMDAIGKPKVNFWVNLFAMCMNYGCMFVGLRVLGWTGAAWGTVASAIINFSVMFYVLHRSIGARLFATFGYVGFAYREIWQLMRKMLGKKDQAASDAMTANDAA